MMLFFPTLSDQYNTGPFEVSLSRNAVNSMGRDKNRIRKSESVMSKILFITNKNTTRNKEFAC
jgi:hypothetical protein